MTSSLREGETGAVRQVPELLDGLMRSYLFEDLTRDDVALLAETAVTRRLDAGEQLWQLGDPADEIYVVLQGEVKDLVVDLDGNEVVHFVHGPGMTFGEPGFFAVDKHRVVVVVAVEPTVLIRLHRRELVPFMAKHPSVKDRVLEGLASATRWQSTMIASLIRQPLVTRVGLRLLELVDSNGTLVGGLPATPKVSQTTLAAMLGVSRENVNRALASLVSDGSVVHDKGRYVLVDEAALRARVGRDWPLAERRDRRLE